MARISKDKLDLEHTDFSFIPSLECDLRCPFCMYCSSPDNHLELDIERVKPFMETVNWDRVLSWGLYGGEPSVNTDLYLRFIKLIPHSTPKFIITNGAWTSARGAYIGMLQFLNLVASNDSLRVIVSGTPEHKKFQDLEIIAQLGREPGFTLKGDDEMHPMGRLAKDDWTCSMKFKWHPQPIRMSIFPTGDVLMQNCDGVYPVLGTCEDPFDVLFNRAVIVRNMGCGRVCRNLNDILREGGLIT